MTDHTDGWTPVRRGDIYCSPLCGGGCTLAQFDLATARASALADSVGPTWRPRVWENLGWHYAVTNGRLELYPRQRGYDLMAVSSDIGSGHVVPGVARGPTIVSVFRLMLKTLDADIATMTQWRRDIADVLG